MTQDVLIKLEKAIAALRRIENFNHDEGCDSDNIPIYECCCYEKSQSEIARDVLQEIEGGNG